MSRTDRHLKAKYIPGFPGWGDWAWWRTVGNKHYRRHPAERAYDSKFFQHSRAKQKRFWQRDIDTDQDS